MTGRWRKKYESYHVSARLQRDVERLARGQAANFDDQGHGFKARVWAATTGLEDGVTGRVLQRRALLVSPAGPISAALRGGWKALRIEPRGHGGGALIGQLRPRLPRIHFVLARRAAPVPLPEPGR